ncbi:uncharacterized protein LOC123690038, partial [Pieris rapae]|uniref:uncharacterized protein LOC123690038 n=1 Tax=Pieris rapae TaxID=64459 RepID=UPI001E28035C
MPSNKRERSINWENEEKQLFRNVIRPYISIIENKDLSTNTNKQKMKAWSDITEKFNLVNLRTRDKKQLMNQWKCTKLNRKKELSSYRRETSKTGGRPQPPSPSFEFFDCDGAEDNNPKVKENHVEPNNKHPQTMKTQNASSTFSFLEASYEDMHRFRALENERLQIEHECRVKNMAEVHSQVMINLKLQTEILMKTLESQNKKNN